MFSPFFSFLEFWFNLWATHLNNTTPLFTIHIKLYCFLFFFFAQSGIAPSGAPAPVPATERRQHQLQLAVYCKAQKKKKNLEGTTCSGTWRDNWICLRWRASSRKRLWRGHYFLCGFYRFIMKDFKHLRLPSTLWTKLKRRTREESDEFIRHQSPDGVMNDNDGRTVSAALAEATAAIGGSVEPSLGSLLDCARSVVSHAPSSASRTTATTFRRSTVSSQQRQRRAQWKGIGSRCMWDAFRATMFSLFCLLVGSIIVIIGNSCFAFSQ